MRMDDEITRVSEEGQRGILFQPIGHVESDFDHPAPPEQMRTHESRLVLAEKFTEGLEGLQVGDRLTVVFFFHLSRGCELQQHPRGDALRPKRGVFTLCSPRRPNPIGVSFVELIGREGRALVVRGLDALNGTPLLDIKPFFVPES